jgi:hypothetical protein
MLKNVLKNILLVSSAVLISFVLLVVGTQIILYITGATLSASQIADGQESFVLVADPIPRSSLILFLVVALCVGGFIGYLTKRLPPLMAAMSLGPFLWFLNAASHWKLEMLYLSLVYVLITIVTSFVVASWRKTST